MTVLRLLPASFRFVAWQALAPRRLYLAGTATALLLSQAALALRSGSSGEPASAPVGILLALGMWALAAPLCRAWLDEDVRLGYGAFWLQAPLSAFQFYLSRLGAILAWGVIVSAVAAATALPNLLLPDWRAINFVANVLAVGWVPIILVVLAFFGSGIGARNAGLFAYALVFGAYALEGVTDALGASTVYEILRRFFPPARSARDAANLLQGGHVAEAGAALLPLAVYGAVLTVLGLLVALRVPRRLGLGE